MSDKTPCVEIEITRPRGKEGWFWRLKIRQGVYAVGDAETLGQAMEAIPDALTAAMAEWESEVQAGLRRQG